MLGATLKNPVAVSLAAGAVGLFAWSSSAVAPVGAESVHVSHGPQESEEFRWSGALRSGQTLEIKGVNGEIKAEGVSGGQAEVVAIKTGRGDDPAEVRIEVVEHEGGVTICAIYPQRSGKKPYECAPGKGGNIGSEDHDVSVKFTVRVPRGIHLAAQTVNGGIEATAIDGDVRASTVNGGGTLPTPSR